MRILLHTGKGGVGKTTLAAATALAAARRGHRVFLLSTDAAHGLGEVLGVRVGGEPVRVAEGVVAQASTALDAIDSGWPQVRAWLRELLRGDADELVVEELLAVPGIEELVSLRALRAVEASGDYDLCVVDCAPTGGALQWLRFPDALRAFMRHFFELERAGARWLRPIARSVGAGRLVPSEALFEAVEALQAGVDDVHRMLVDPARTTARIVVEPERVVVDEALRAFAYLSLHGVATDAVIANRRLPALGDSPAARLLAGRAAREREQLERIAHSFPLPLLSAPLCEREPIGTAALARLGEAVFGERDPAARLAASRPLEVVERGAGAVVSIAVGAVARDDVEVDALVGGGAPHLLVRVRDARRRIALPAGLAGCTVERARLARGRLEIELAR